MRDPQPLLLLPLLARAHRHARILRIIPVDHTIFSVPESRLAPRAAKDEYVGYSQKCTHLSCAVYYSQAENRLECPCHKGFFSVKDGAVLQGPPSRPLPRIVLEARGEQLVAVEVKG